ncbi:MAG: hypothetical protein GJ680_09645 [Alteromonadaceae bacterium]|nr:hypothetical protein [Alteromonadaceae bacterium]
MNFPHYRFSIFLLVHGLGLAIYGLFQNKVQDTVLMLIGGCLVMAFGSFKYWIAKQTDPDKLDTLRDLSPQSRKNEIDENNENKEV